jgi:hypothetical protein
VPKAGPDKRLCGAQRTNQPPGVLCEQRAGWGTEHPGVGHCKRHGGSTRSQTVAARREQAEQAVISYGLPREVDPHTALLEELWRTAGHVAWLRERVAELEPHEVVGAVVTTRPLKEEKGAESAIERVEEHGAPAPHIWIQLYQRERAHLAQIAKTCVQVGIEERRVKLAEQQGELLAQVIRGVLTDLGVANKPEVPAVVRKHLSLVAAGG